MKMNSTIDQKSEQYRAVDKLCRLKIGDFCPPPPPLALFLLFLFYTSDAADDLLCVDLGGRRVSQKKQSPIKSLSYTCTRRSTETSDD